MKYLNVILITLFTQFVTGQVGIGTTLPKQKLHIAGQTSTIRIEGLNQTNNINNNGVGNAQVSVNAQGDLVLQELKPEAEVNLLGASFLPSQVLIRSTNGAWQTRDLATGSFNLTDESLINGVYEIGVTNIAFNSGTTISDGAPRLLSILVYIDGVQVSRDSKSYTSSTNRGAVVNGQFVLSGNFFKKLASGHHTYKVVGVVYGGSHSVRANFGGLNTIDILQILAF